MRGIARNKIWRLLVVAIAVGAVISLNMFTAAPAKPVAVTGFHVAMAAGAQDPDALAKNALKSPFGPAQSADDQAYAERAFPASTLPDNGYPNGTYEYNLVEDSGLAPNWGERGPLVNPNSDDFVFSLFGTVPINNVSGRGTAFTTLPSSCAPTGGNCMVQYLGTASGGVYKTTNGGQTWMPLFDHLLRESIGGITIDPSNSNIIYVGEGEGNNSADSDHGVGIYRSTDGGVTWTLLPGADPTDNIANVFVNRSVTRIVVDPRTAGSTSATLYVGTTTGTNGCATTYDTCVNAPGRPPLGFFYSTNGGQTWTQSNPTDVPANFPSNSDRVNDLIIDPANPNVLYASFAELGVYRTTTDGLATGPGVSTNWTRLAGQPPIASFYRVTTALAPSTAFSSSQLMYVAYNLCGGCVPATGAGNVAGPEKIYQASIVEGTGAATFTAEPNPDACDGQCWYDMPLAVDPNNSQIVYAGGSANYGYLFNEGPTCATLYPLNVNCNATLMKSTDGGATWRDLDVDSNGVSIHPDDHFIYIDPADPTTVYTTDDGGIFRANGANGDNTTSNGPVTTWTSENNGIGSLQFQGIGVGPTENVIGGTQDNGTFLTHNGSTTSSHPLLGDGGQGVADPFNPNRYYSEQYGATMYRLDSPTCDFEPGNFPGGYPDCGQTWISPFAYDYFDLGGGSFYQPQTTAVYNPNGTQASNNIFHGTYRVWRSEDYGGVDINHDGDATDDPNSPTYWVPISPDLSAGTASNGTDAPQTGYNIVFMTVAPYDPNTMVVGTSNGGLFITHNALAPVVTNEGTNYCALAPDPVIGNNTAQGCWYVSGVNWTEIDAPLPGRVPTEAAFIGRSNTEFAVTFSGFDVTTPGYPGHVFLTYNSGATWSERDGSYGQSTTLPDLPFNSIQYNAVTGHLYAAADLGVFMSTNLGVTWFRIDKNLPNTPVYQLRLDPEDTTLYAATHGRGIWQVHAP